MRKLNVDFTSLNCSLSVDYIENVCPTVIHHHLNENLLEIKIAVSLKADISQDDWRIVFHKKNKQVFHWSPHLTPENGYVIDRHVFRCPALICHDNEQMLAIMIDEKSMCSDNRIYMDMNAIDEEFTIGFSNTVVTEHVLFKKAPGQIFKKGTFNITLYLYHSSSANDLSNPFRPVLSFYWNKIGAPSFSGMSANSLTAYCHHTYKWAFENWGKTVWQEFTIDNQLVGAATYMANYTQSPNYNGIATWRESVSIWNQAWFSSLRSASGLYRYARRYNRQDLLVKANMTKELALKAPVNNGLFPSVVATRMHKEIIDNSIVLISDGWDTLYWGNQDRNPFSRDYETSPLHIPDMSTTCLQMLRWYTELDADKRLLEFSINYADRLITLSDEEGFFPSWVDENGNPKGILDKSPQTSISITFLTKLYEITKNSIYLEAAEKAMSAIIENIIPHGRWEDFETYWSCCRYGGDHVGLKFERNDMYKQCNLSMFWTCEALLCLYHVTTDKNYLNFGQRVLDELLMTQSLFQPSDMRANLFGGFGVMNCDGEWLDARQSLFAETIIEYGQTLKNNEYINRGLAALKASFAMMYCPENAEMKKEWENQWPFFNEKDYGFTMENYGHNGIVDENYSGIGEFTIYDWGNGAASETFMRILDHNNMDLSTNNMNFRNMELEVS